MLIDKDINTILNNEELINVITKEKQLDIQSEKLFETFFEKLTLTYSKETIEDILHFCNYAKPEEREILLEALVKKLIY
jgi:hypothetical protein